MIAIGAVYMKLVMTLLVRDEKDIIKENIDFHLSQGVDHIVVVDNGSVDGTRDILADCARSGPVTVLDEAGRDYAQSTWTTRAAMVAQETHGADWIFSNDADEFWVSPKGNLRDGLEETDANQLVMKRFNMVYGWDQEFESPWVDRITHRISKPIPRPTITDIYADVLPAPYFYLDLPPKVMFRSKGLHSVAMGNHAVKHAGGQIRAPSESTIYHFPVRSRSQFERKVQQGGSAIMSNPALSENMGWHWRRWYRLLTEKGIEAVLEDALPSVSRLEADKENGMVDLDLMFRDRFHNVIS